METFDRNVWQNACTGMITDECDILKIKYICLTNFKSNRDNPSFFGFARTVDLEAGDYKDENIRLGLGFLDSLGPSDVLFVKGSDKFAYFGELMTRYSIKKNIEGVIINGATRDNNYTHNKKLNILFNSKTPVDIKGRGRVRAVDVDLKLTKSVIKSHAFVFADSDGIVIIDNKDLNIVQNAVKLVIQKEKRIIEAINSDMTIKDIIDNYESF
jgi:regulator of RNase E activity RraA